MRPIATPALILAILCVAATAHATVWHVYEDGSGDAPTIQGAIDLATAGDQVLVHAGTYVEHVVMKDAVSLLGIDGPELTTIMAPGPASWLPTVTASGVSQGTVLWGFTIGGGGESVGLHGNDCSLLIANNRFVDNVAWDVPPPPTEPDDPSVYFAGGAAITLYGTCYAEISNNHFEDNVYATYHSMGAPGGCVFVQTDGAVVIRSNEFRNNGQAGGVCVYGDCTIANNLVLNTRDQEEALAADHGIAVIENNIIARTIGTQGMTPYGPTYPYTHGIRVNVRGGVIQRNTIFLTCTSYMYGPPDPSDAWGGISTRVNDDDPTTLLVERNLVVSNGRQGIYVATPARTTLSCNLTYGQLSDVVGTDPGNSHLFANPFLCNVDANDFRLPINSPARTSPCGLIGAVSETCGTVTGIDAPGTPALSLRAVPNPFNPTTTIRAAVPVPGRVVIEVYDVAGRHVRTLFDRTVDAGDVAVTWDGTSARGVQGASGVYFVRLTASGLLTTEKVVLLK